LPVAHQLQGPVRDHLVGVHVGGGAGASLKDVEAELVVQLPVDQFPAGAFDALEDLTAELTAIAVGPGGRHPHPGEGPDQVGVEPQLDAGYMEILEGPGRLNAVVRVRGYGQIPQEIMFDSRARLRHEVLLAQCPGARASWAGLPFRTPLSISTTPATLPSARTWSEVVVANKCMARAITPVHPVWWLAPMPAPLSPWKYS